MNSLTSRVPELLSSAILNTLLNPKNPLAPLSHNLDQTFSIRSSMLGFVEGDAG